MAKVRKRQWRNGKDKLCIAWVCDWADMANNRHRKQFSTKREADQFRVEIEGQMRDGTYRHEAEKMTVTETLLAFLEYCELRRDRNERMTEHNYRTYKGHIFNHILHNTYGIGGLSLRKFTTSRVCEFRDRLRDLGTTVPTTRRILATLRSAMEFAIMRDYIATNPVRGVRVLGARDEGTHLVVPPSKKDVRILLEATDEDFYVKLLFASSTGIRAGELHALRWKHIDQKAGEVHIKVRVDAFRNEGPPKSAAGVRTIPMSQPVLLALREWNLRSRFSRKEDLVFPNARGNFVSHNNMSKRQFRPLFDKTGVTPFPWHALRHFAISCWIEAGLQPKVIQTFAGHSSLEVTMDRYGHLFKSDNHKTVMDRIAEEFMSGE